MDSSAPISWLITEIRNLVSSGAVSAATGISTAITPLVSVCFGIYMILICYNYLRGAETEPVLDMGLRMAGFAIVIGLGLNADNYAYYIMPIVQHLGSDLANAITGSGLTESSLDALAKHYIKIIDDGFEATSGITKVGASIVVAIKALIVILGLVPFLVAAALAIIAADVGSLIISMVGPFFFACLLFPATRQYFSAWLNAALSYAFIPMFIAVIASLSISLSTKMLTSNGASSLDETSFFMVFLSAIGNIILLYLLKQVAALASSLSAGGINMQMPSSLGAAASGSKGAVKGMRKAATGFADKAAKAAVRLKTLGTKLNSIRKAG